MCGESLLPVSWLYVNLRPAMWRMASVNRAASFSLFPNASLLFLNPTLLVHEPRFPADKSFVNFNLRTGAAHLHERLFLQSVPYTLKHEPCGLLGNSQSASEFMRTYAVLAVHQHPESSHPLVES